MKSRLFLMLLLAVILLFSFAGCGGSSATSVSGLEGPRWVLESYGPQENPQPLIKGTEITVAFDSAENRIHGSAGCNSYSGGYKLEDGLTLSMLASTEMYCMDPEGVMDQETEYLKILQSAESYTIEGNELRIYCGENILIYNPSGD